MTTTVDEFLSDKDSARRSDLTVFDAEDIAADSATLAWWALDRPAVRPISLNLTVGSAGVDLTGDQLSTIAVFSDRLEPEF